MQTYAYEYTTYFQIIVTDGTKENTLDFNFTKDQDLTMSIQVSQQLFNEYMSQKNIVPIPV